MISDLRPDSVSRPVDHQPSSDDVAAAERGQPAQLDGEQVDQPDADQERRQAHADQRERHHGVGEDAAPVDRRVDPERDPDDQREQRGEDRELDGRGQALAQQVGDRPRPGGTTCRNRRAPCRSTKLANWIGIGSFSPSRSASSARSFTEASWPTMLATGSPTKRNIENASSATASMTTTAWARLRRR